MSDTKSPELPNGVPQSDADRHLAKLLKTCHRLGCGEREVLALLKHDTQIHRLLGMTIDLYLTRQARAKRHPIPEST